MPAPRAEGTPYALALQPGALVGGQYRLLQVLGGSSAVAVTYLAQDEAAQEQVIVKEFVPRALVGRAADGTTVRPHSEDDASNFARGLRRFVREAEVLNDITHPNIPRVRDYFTANGTAYLVEHYYDGKTAAEYAESSGGRVPVDRAVGLVVQVLEGLQALHAEGIIHGYVAPDNILVTDESSALVLGLGTSRFVVGNNKEPIPGFAPIEEYASKEVGPWTDVYACAAVLYTLLTGTAPTSAIERAARQMSAVSWAGESDLVALRASDLPPLISRVMMSGLAHSPDRRPHSAAEFRRRLETALGPEPREWPSGLEPRGRDLRWPSGTQAKPADILDRLSNAAIVLPPEPAPADDDGATAPAASEDRTLAAAGWAFARRLLRSDVGVGVAAALAAAAVLLVVALGRGRNDGRSDWAAADVVSPPLARAASAQVPATGGASPATERIAPTRQAAPPTTPDDGARLAAPRQQGEFASSGATARPTHVPPPRKAAPSAPSALERGKPASGQSDRAAEAPLVTASPISLSLPPAVGQVELLPTELLTELRQRLEYGNEQVEFGEYAKARRIFRDALEQIAALSKRYPETQALRSVKQQAEQSAERALASCAAENDVIRKRNGKPLPCE